MAIKLWETFQDGYRLINGTKHQQSGGIRYDCGHGRDYGRGRHRHHRQHVTDRLCRR